VPQAPAPPSDLQPAGEGTANYHDTDLVIDQAGNLYGSSVLGGTFGGGTFFKVTPSGATRFLYSFTGGA